VTSSHVERRPFDRLGSSGSISLRTTAVVPCHGPDAASSGGADVHASATAPPGLADAVLAVVRTACSLGATTPVGIRAAGRPEVRVRLDQPWRDAARLVEVLVSGVTTVHLLLAGESGGEFRWTLTEEEFGLRVELRAAPGAWYEQVLRVLPHAVVRVLEQAAADPARLVGDLDGLDRSGWLADSHGPARALGPDDCLLAHVGRVAAVAPDAVAVSDHDRSLTYAALLAEAERIAALLHDHDVKQGELVALDVDRGCGLVAAMLGAWRARCAFVALDPRDSDARRAHVLDIARPCLVLGEGGRDSAPAKAGALRRVDVSAQPRGTVPGECCRPDDRAYVMFTSGSTGAPKGATVAHDGMLNHALAKLDDLGVTADDLVAQTGPISFDIVVWQCVAPLVRGARVVVIPDEDVRDPRRTLQALGAAGVTVWQALPALIRAALETSVTDRPTLERLRWIVPTGDALPTDLCHEWLGAYPHVPLLNTYGSTECSDDQCHHVVDQVRVSDPPVMLLGRPIPGMAALVLDDEGRVAPPGVPGELYIGGIGVGPGYWRRPDLTAGRFGVLPGLEPEGRLYRSGDLARRRTDGAIEFLGRVDGTVKVRGRRVETALVEEAVRRHPAVQDCAVVGHRSDADLTESRLVAFIVAPDGLPDDLLAHVATTLDEHHVPDHVARIAALPLSANGKVDRSALQVLAAVTRGSGSGGLDNGPQSLVARLWSEVLGVEDIGRFDDFFALGGHSLAVGRMLGRLEAETGLRLPLHTLYDHPTVAALATVVERGADAPVARTRIDVVAADEEPGAPVPLTDLQQAYWVGESDFLGGGRMQAHLYCELDACGLDVARVERALDCLVASHDALRLVLEDGEQRALAHVPPVSVTHVVTDAHPVAEHERVVERTRRRFRDEGPTTSTWPLFDFAVVERAGVQRVFVAISLIIADAATEAILIRDFATAYADDCAAAPKYAGPAYRDVARAVDSAQQENGDDDVVYWSARLGDHPRAPALPWAAEAESLTTRHFTRRTWSLPQEEWAAFRARAAAHGLTPTAALFATYVEVLAHWSKTPRFAVNTLVSLRLPLGEQVDGLAGNLSSTIPSVVDCAAALPFSERARGLQRGLVSDLEHARTSGVALMRRIAAERGWSEAASLPVVFASTLDVDNPSTSDLPFPSRVVSSGVQTPHVWLDHQVYVYGERFYAVFDSVDAAFQDGVIEDLWSAYCRTVHALAMSNTAWEEVLRPEGTTAPPAIEQHVEPLLLDGTVVLHGAFVRRAIAAPNAVAVSDPVGVQLSYGDVLARAQHVAATLRDIGVGRGDLVAHVMDRGWEQVVAILGTSMAGAAYLPVDASLPDERVRYLVDQATVGTVLTQTRSLNRLRELGIAHVDISSGTETDVPCVLVDGGAGPADTAYVIFTSGSTGQPKGVTIDHRGAVNTIAAINEMAGLTDRDVVLALSSTSFDLSVWDIFGTLAAGGHLVLLAPEEYRDPAHWHQQVTTHGVTVWNSVPALLDMYACYLESGVATGPRPALRLAIVSGDWIPVSLPDRARNRVPGLKFVSLGGATEASIWSIAFPVAEVDPAWVSIPYGTALPGQGMHVVDEQLEPRPDWAVGEICISGVGLALGYWRDPVRTAERFVVHPRTGLRLYRTGDLGRRRPDGVIEFFGREDDQVKIQGHRIELGEIEACLNAHPDVTAAVVVVHDSAENGRTLAAYVVVDDSKYDAAAMRRHVAGALPSYMVPQHVNRLDRLPLTPNGKADRSALPSPTNTAGRAASAGEVQAGKFEAAVLHEMREVLGVGEEFDADDSFFGAGGNSFAAMRLVGRLRSRLGVDLRLSRVFDAGSAGAVARLLESAAGDDRVLVPLRPRGQRVPVFLVHPVGGAVTAYADLVDALDPERPVFGLQATVSQRSESVSAMATTYADVVEEARPTGSLILGGWSMGGVVAVEVARCLRERGRDVDAVLVVDSMPTPEHGFGQDLAASFLFDLAGGRETDDRALVALRAVVGQAPYDGDPLAMLVAEGLVPDGADEVVLRERYDIFAVNANLLSQHRTAPYDALTVVVHATASHLKGDQTADDWSRLCPSARLHPVEADHYTVVRGAAARVVAAALEEVAR